MAREYQRLMPIPVRGGHIAFRWRDTPSGPLGSFWYDGKRLAISGRIDDWRNGAHTVSQLVHPDTGGPLDEMPVRRLLDELAGGTVSLEPFIEATGMARLAAIRDPNRFATDHWVLVAGHNLSGAIYNSSIMSNRRVEVRFDLAARTATYVEYSNFDDG